MCSPTCFFTRSSRRWTSQGTPCHQGGGRDGFGPAATACAGIVERHALAEPAAGPAITGTPETLDAISRKHLVGYLRDHYVAGGTLIAALED